LFGLVCALLPACVPANSSATGSEGELRPRGYDPTSDPRNDPGPVLDPNPPASLDGLAARYSHFDMNGDGYPEINSIAPLPFEPATPLGTGQNGLALVLVDPRILDTTRSGSLGASVLARLQTYRDDLVREGYKVRFFSVDLYKGIMHQDGLTLLALRRFLQEVRTNNPSFTGVTLVGSFPEATIFRRVLYRDGGDLKLRPERINPGADIVLGDLDGNWEPLYQVFAAMEDLVMNVTSTSSWPSDGQTLSGVVSWHDFVRWEDVFFIKDDDVSTSTVLTPAGGTHTVQIGSAAPRNPELSALDRVLPNPMARPEIIVSRINARGVAKNPDPALLDTDGKPKEGIQPDYHIVLAWHSDPILEQRILDDYFDRNHQFRTGLGPVGNYRVSAIREKDSGLIAPSDAIAYLSKADPLGFSPAIGVDDAIITTFVSWLGTPAVLRQIEAHSDGTISNFGAAPTTAELLTAIGGRPWGWVPSTSTNSGYVFTPSADGWSNNDWALGRTLWENRVLASAGNNFYIHGGCSVSVPDGNEYNLSYDDDKYDWMNNAETVLFFENGLGELARGKVFNDTPTGAGDSIRAAGGRFGFAWKGAFAADGADATLKPGTSGDGRILNNKKAYFWDLFGDWTLRIKY
jgi:hypothetical protein